MQVPTVADVVSNALETYATLIGLGEQVADEWQYVTDLSTAWRARLANVAASRGLEAAPEGSAAAVAALGDEVALIVDPHRAIDWLSTLPQIVLAALDEAG